MGIVLQVFVFLKPWLGSFSLDHFPFRDWRDVSVDTLLSTTVMGYVDAGFVLLSAIFLYRNRELLRALPYRRLWFVFLGLLLVTSVLVAPSPVFALRRLVKVSLLFSMYAVTFVLVKKQPANAARYLKWVLWAAWIPVVYGLGDFALHADSSWEAISNRQYREYSTFLHANPFAYFCVVVLVVAVVMWRYQREDGRSGRKWPITILVILALFALTSTGTRAAIAGAFVAYLLAVRLGWRLKAATISVALIVLLQVPTFSNPIKAVGQVALGSKPSLTGAVLDLANNDDFEHTSELLSRLAIWNTMLASLGEHYAVGRGLGSSASFLEEETGVFLNSHNDYITLAFETGMSGLGLYWSMLVGLAWLLIRSRRKLADNSPSGVFADGGLFLVVFLALISFTDNLFVDDYNMPLIWSFLGAATARVLPNAA